MNTTRNFNRKEIFGGYLFILPNFLGFVAFVLFPVVYSLYLAFVEWDLITPMKFVGFANFRKILGFHLKVPLGEAVFFTSKFSWVYSFSVFCLIIGGLMSLLFFIRQLSFSKKRLKGYLISHINSIMAIFFILTALIFFLKWGLYVQNSEGKVFISAKETLIAGKTIAFSLGFLFFGFVLSLYGVVKRNYKSTFRKAYDILFSYSHVIFILCAFFLSWSFSNNIWEASDQDFWKCLGNTLFMMLAIPIGMFASLAIAILMSKKLRGVVFFRTIYFLPTICAGVAIYIIWKMIFDTEIGQLNSFLSNFGIQKIGWLTTTQWSKPSLMIMGVWIGAGGYNMILYLAGLHSIPLDLYEAANIDGANGWQKFWAITWPMLSPTTFFIFVMSVIRGFQSGFDAAYIMTQGGPADSTTTLSYYIYNNAYQWFNMGYAATIAWILFGLVFIVTIFNWKFGGKVIHY